MLARKLQLPWQSGSWSFPKAIPKLELGNQENNILGGWAAPTSLPLVTKLPLGNAIPEAPASQAIGKLELPQGDSQAGAWEPGEG